jgi:hypothetical protein
MFLSIFTMLAVNVLPRKTIERPRFRESSDTIILFKEIGKVD